MELSNLNKDWKDKRKRRTSIDISTMVYGKVPPQAKDLEEVVLGAIMLDKRAMDTVMELLKPECFYVDAHQRIYRAMCELSKRYQPIDIMTVIEELKRMEELEMVGGPYYVTRLTNSVVSAANIETHTRIIIQKFIGREIIRIGGEMISEAYEDSTDVFNLLDEVENNVFGITANHLKKDFSKADTVVLEVVKDIEARRHHEDHLTGVPTGSKKLDRLTNGWQPTDLIILAARPSVGKTAFALNLARNALFDALKPTAVGFFSLEMSKKQLMERLLSAESEIWLERIKRGKMEDDHMQKLYREGVQKYGEAPLFIDDVAGLTMFELRAKARRMVSKYNVGLIIIDYLQLMTGDTNKSDNREREISKISRELKKLAKDLGVPVIALSQMSRDVEKRSDKKPQLSDLRESGAIEQDADVVIFLYRPSKKDIAQDPELRNKGLVDFAKHRNGSLDEFVFEFRGEIQKWKEIDENSQEGSWKAIQLPLNGPVPKDFSQPDKPAEQDDDLPF